MTATSTPKFKPTRRIKIYTVEARGNQYDLVAKECTAAEIAYRHRELVEGRRQLLTDDLHLQTAVREGQHETAGFLTARMGKQRNQNHWLEGWIEAAKSLAASLQGVKDEQK